jgi:hypothetical protein
LNQNATKVYRRNDIEQASCFLSAIAAALNRDTELKIEGGISTVAAHSTLTVK